MITTITDSFIIAKRDILRSLRQKSQLLGSLVRPVIWLFLLGNGLRGSVSAAPNGISYTQYIFPGVLFMNVLFAALMSGTTIIWDREFGFLKEIMVAPVSRISIVLGKTISGSAEAAVEGIIVLCLFPFVGLHLSLLQLVMTVVALFVVALPVTAIGILIASKMRSFQGYGTVNNFVGMPMFFLSGAMYPVTNVPQWLSYLILINPATYGVRLLRGIVLGIEANYVTDAVVLLGVALAVLLAATSIFINDRK